MQENQCSFVQSVDTTMPNYTLTSGINMSLPVPYDVDAKAQFLLKIWREISYRVEDDAVNEVVKTKKRILSELNNLLDEVFPADLEIPVYANPIPYLEPQYNHSTGVILTSNSNDYLSEAVEKQKKEQEKQEFINFMFEILSIAEQNRNKKADKY